MASLCSFWWPIVSIWKLNKLMRMWSRNLLEVVCKFRYSLLSRPYFLPVYVSISVTALVEVDFFPRWPWPPTLSPSAIEIYLHGSLIVKTFADRERVVFLELALARSPSFSHPDTRASGELARRLIRLKFRLRLSCRIILFLQSNLQ